MLASHNRGVCVCVCVSVHVCSCVYANKLLGCKLQLTEPCVLHSVLTMDAQWPLHKQEFMLKSNAATVAIAFQYKEDRLKF